MPLVTRARSLEAAPTVDASQIQSTQVVEELEDDQGNVLYSATYDVLPDKELKCVQEEWFSEELRSVNQEETAPPAPMPRGAGATAMAAAKLAWEIIKDNKATAITEDTKSSVLSAADTDPMNYANSKRGQSASYTWKVRDSLIKEVVYVDITVRAEGYLHGQPTAHSSAPPGFYLPSIYFNVSNCSVNFPVTAKGSANLEAPANVGNGEEAVAEVRMHAKMAASWVFQSLNISVGFLANGRYGFRLLGRE